MLGTFAAVQLALRVALVFHYGFDTDEPQHLHVSWAWVQGLVPYRDVFDNHAPLFHLIMAPLVASIGEWPEILLVVRLAMIPIAAIALGCLYAIGREVFGSRVGVWAAVLVGLMPSFLLTSVEFRADDLWAALWLAALAVAAGDPRSPRRGFAAGLLFGATFATSIKTVLLFSTLLAGTGLAFAFDPARRTRLRNRRLWISLLACAGGMALPLVALALLFAALGALPELVDCAFTYNLAGAALWNQKLVRVSIFIGTLPVIIASGCAVLRRSASRPFARSALLLATLLYGTVLNGFWPVVTRQDWLPFFPLLALFLVAAMVGFFERGRLVRPCSATTALATVAVVEVLLTLWVAPPWSDRTHFEIGLLRDALRLTRPEDPVMDLKGESVFRRRPFYYVLETITEQRFRLGQLHDDIPERLIATRTYVSVMDSSRFPPAARRFLLDNYVPVGHLRVAGKFLDIGESGQSTFVVRLPGRYTILSPRGPVNGSLDGTTFDGSRMLTAGPHRFVASSPTAPIALVWSEAAERGFSPFNLQDLPR